MSAIFSFILGRLGRFLTATGGDYIAYRSADGTRGWLVWSK